LTPAPSPELRIGRVTGAHGLRGAVKVELLTDFPDRFASGNEVSLDGRRLTIRDSEPRDAGLLVTFEEINDRDGANELNGLYITLPLSAARQLPEDRFYHFQLVGLTVFDLRQQREIGLVEEVLTYSANDVLRVRSGKADVLIPMVKNIVRTIEPSKGRITVDLPEEVEA
jgi:16S rRNA processing protein RimM